MTFHGPYTSEPKAPYPLFMAVQPANELKGPFFTGFMEGAGSQATVIDGGELYYYRTPTQFLDSYNWRKYTIASDAVDSSFIPLALRPLWPGKINISFALYNKPNLGADMNPAIMRTTVANAMRQADRHVWLYVEGMTFLKPASQGGASDE